MTALGLTRRQADALRFIGGYFAEHGYAPTYVEICEGLGMKVASKSVMHYRVHRLVVRGYVTMRYGSARTILLTDAGRAYCKQFTATGSYSGPASGPSTPSLPARPVGRCTHDTSGQGRRAGIHFRRLEAES